jgi:hypothetical protein
VAYKEYRSDEEKAKRYNVRVKAGEAANSEWRPQVLKDWSRYNGKSGVFAKTADGHNVGVPVAVSIIDSLYSSMTAVEVDITVSARGSGTEDQAYVATAGLSQEWERCKVNPRTAKCVKDALLGGIGWVKVGYDYYEEEQELPREDADVRAEVEARVKELQEAQAEGLTNLPDADDVLNNIPLTYQATVVLNDRIVVDYVPWDMVLWDPTAKQVEDVHWVAQKNIMEVEEVRQDPAFREYVARNRQTKLLDEFSPDLSVAKPKKKADTGEDEERVTVYTMYDLDTGTVCTFVKGEKWLLNETVNPFALNDDVEDKNPFVPLVLRDTTTSLRGVSDMDVMRDTLSELDIYHSRLGTYLERMAPKVITKARAMTPAGKQAMRSQEYGAVVELEEGFEATDLQPFSPPQLMSEMYQMTDKLEAALREATGVNELMRGLFPDRKRTATETSEVVSASAARQSEKRIQLERFYKAIASRMLQLMQMFYEQERMVRLVDDAGEFAWSFSSDDIVFDYALDLALTPKEAKSWQSRRDQALATLNILGPMAQPGPDGSAPVNVTELLRYVLSELNIPRRIMSKILHLPEEKQAQVLGQLQNTAAQANAQAGLPRPDMVPGPLNADALAAATNQGTIPPEVLAAASGGGPMAPQAVERVSEAG